MTCFIQSYESNTALDASILIAPLVFFVAPCDPRFTNTLDRILLPPEKGGLTSTGLVYRYNTDVSDDGTFYTHIFFLYLANLISLCRCWWERGCFQYVHLLAGRSNDTRQCLRAQVPN